MADVVVTTREDREAAARDFHGDGWREILSAGFAQWVETGDAECGRRVDVATVRAARGRAAARAAERERCAGMAREMAKKLDEDAKRLFNSGNPFAPPTDFDRECDGKAEQAKETASDLRDLAERIGKGE